MNATFIFNIGFDIIVAALIIFVGWFYIDMRNKKKAFKWLAGSILASILGTLIIGYGSTKITKGSGQSTQDQYEIKSLSHKINKLENGNGLTNSGRTRVVNQSTANQIKSKAQSHHKAKINLNKIEL